MTKDDISCRKITVSSADHGKMLVEGLWSFFRTQHRTDCDLLLDQKSIRSHRIILEIFLSSGKLHSTTEAPRTIPSRTDLLDGSSCILNLVLEFLYKGIVVIPEERRDELLEAAKKLDCAVLVNAIETCGSNNDYDRLSGIKLDNERGDTKAEVSCNDENFERVIQPTGPLIRDARVDDCRHEAESVFEPVVKLLEPKVELHSDSEDQQSFMYEFGTGDCDDDRWCVQGNNAKTESRVGETRLMNSEDGGYSINSGAVEGMEQLGVPFSGVEGGALGGLDFQQDEVDADYNLVRKMRKVPTKIYNCVQCEFESPNRPCYYRHLKSVHGVTSRGKPAPKHKCSECDYESISLEHVVRHHKTTHQKEKQFKCSYCKSTFSLKNNLEKHVDVVHDLGPSLYSCSTCCLRCSSQADLVRHQRIHSKEKPFKCKDCGMMFRQKKDQVRHWDVFHSSSPNRYTCETCHKRCSSQSQLVDHTRTHTKERPFQCPSCEYAGSRRDHLKRHLMNVHKIFI